MASVVIKRRQHQKLDQESQARGDDDNGDDLFESQNPFETSSSLVSALAWFILFSM